jgi:hypothetical protein
MLKLAKQGNLYVIPEILCVKRKYEHNYPKEAKQRLGGVLIKLAAKHDLHSN